MSAYDFSDARPSPEALVGHEVLVYCGRSRPSVGYLAALGAAGVPYTFIFESDPNRSQAGYQAGVVDAQFADARVAEVGYPAGQSLAVVVSDGTASNPSLGGPQIAAYASGWAATSSHPLFFYGNRYAVSWALSGASGGRLVSTTGGWIPTSWGADPARDLLGQEANIPSPVPGTDLNTIYHPYRTGGDMPLTDDDVAKVLAALGPFLFDPTVFGMSRMEAALQDHFKNHPIAVPPVTTTATGEDVRAIVREELDKTKLAG